MEKEYVEYMEHERIQQVLWILSSFITPEGSKISHKNTKIHKITHTTYDTKLHISTHIHTIKR